jgi:hypothetical protein
MEPLLAIPEHKVVLPGRGYPTQMDVWVLGRMAEGLVSIGVEGKVGEPFGETIAEWNRDQADGRAARLEGLAAVLSLQTIPGHVHYQLVHRTAGAVLEGKRFGASTAMMLVHAFRSPQSSFEAYASFCELFGAKAERNVLHPGGSLAGISLWLGWVDGDTRYLDR